MAEYAKLNDNELARLLQLDDEQAFSEIYNRYAATLTGFTMSRLGDLDDASDIIHDLFLKLWKDRATIFVTGELRSYLFTIARNRIIDHFRKNLTRTTYQQALQSLAASTAPDGQHQMEVKELKQHIENALAGLSPRVREVYNLSRNEHLSIPEIAGKLQVSEQTVKNQLTTALAHLRKILTRAVIPVLWLWWFS